MTLVDDIYVLSSGREIHTDWIEPNENLALDPTPAERSEIARHMANLWATWGDLPFRVD